MKLFISKIYSRLLYEILCGIMFCSCILNAQTPKYFTSTPIWCNNLNCNGIRIAQTSAKDYVVSGNTLDPINTRFRVFIANINQVGEFTGFQEFIKQDTLSHTGSMATNHNKKRLLNAGAVIDTNNTRYHSYYLLTDFNGNLLNESIDSMALAGYENLFYAASNAFDGGYIVAGQSSAAPVVSGGGYVPYHPYVVKLDSLGNRQWDRLYTAYGPPLFAWIKAIQTAPNSSGYFLLGTTGNAVVGDALLIKIDTAGNELWHKTYDLSIGLDEFIGEQGSTILPTSDGGLIITVYHRDPDPFTGCCPPFVVGRKGVFIKTDSLGNVIWDTIRMTLDDDSDEIISFVPEPNLVETPDGNYVAAGHRIPLAGQLDGELVKVSNSGKVLWRRTYDIDGFDDYIYDMIPSPDGGFVMCGRSETVLPPWGLIARLLIIKTNCMGLLTQPQAAFTYSPLYEALVQFTNQTLYAYPDSIDGGYYIWDFGDGSPPYLCGQGYAPCTGNTLTHQYPAPGTYTATLTAIVCTDTSVVQQVVTAQTVGILPHDPIKEENILSVYPNPAQNTLTFTLNNVLKSPSGDLGVNGNWQVGDLEVTILTLTGQTVLKTTLSAGEVSKTISVAQLPVDLYIYVVSGSGVVGEDSDNGNVDYGGNGGATILARGKVAVLR